MLKALKNMEKIYNILSIRKKGKAGYRVITTSFRSRDGRGIWKSTYPHTRVWACMSV